MVDDAQPTALAALMLVESVMLALMESGVVGQDEIAGAIEDVIASQRTLAAEDAEPAVVEAASRMVHRLADRLIGALPRARRR